MPIYRTWKLPRGWCTNDATRYLPQIVLRKIHQDFLNDVNLDGTCIMDDLVLDQIMTEDERESIVGERTSKRRKEAFLQLMKGRLSCNNLTTKFTQAIAEEHPEFAMRMKQMISEISHDPVSVTKCSVCNMKQHVLVKYIAGYLYSSDSITENLYQELRSDLSNASKWIKLEESNVNPGLIFEAIQSQFPEVYKCLEGTTSLVCKCTIPSSSGSESCSEYGTVTNIANEDDLASMLSHSLSITYSKGSAPTREYDMSSDVKGYAILINDMASNPSRTIQTFYQSDTVKLEKLMKEFGFKTRVYTNTSAHEMQSLLREVANLDHSAFDAFVCVVHSELTVKRDQLYILDATGRGLLLDDLKGMFTSSKCKSLAGKPKIFILPSGNRKRHMGHFGDHPDEADFLVVRATSPGFGVFGGEHYNGSLWVHVFQECVRKHAESLDFVSLLTLVASEVGSYTSSLDGLSTYKQSPQLESTFRKLLFLGNKKHESVYNKEIRRELGNDRGKNERPRSNKLLKDIFFSKIKETQ